MRLVPIAAAIWLATNSWLSWVPRPTIVTFGCAVVGMCWLTYSAYRMAAQRDLPHQ
jgi:hypothetical protein